MESSPVRYSNLYCAFELILPRIQTMRVILVDNLVADETQYSDVARRERIFGQADQRAFAIALRRVSKPERQARSAGGHSGSSWRRKIESRSISSCSPISVAALRRPLIAASTPRLDS